MTDNRQSTTDNRQPPIRILRVITWLPVGGIERKIVDVLPRLDRARFEPSLVCLRRRGPLADELERAGVPVEVIPFKSRWDPVGLARLASLMRRRKIDVVHSHMYRSNVPATVAARMAGVRRVWCQVHNVGTWETPRQRSVDRFLCRWRAGMIAVSERVRRDVMTQLALPPGRVRLLYNGVDLSRFGSEEARRAGAELRAAEGVGAEETVFLFAARLVGQKRPLDFLETAAALLREGAAPARFWVLGDGPIEDEMERRAAEIPHGGRIKLFGRRDDVPRFMAAADVFLQCSTKEGFSNALLEAMASGLAVAATDVGGNAEAVREGIDGFILPPGEPGALTAAAARLLADPELRRRLAASAHERAREFDLEAMVRNVERLYLE